MHFVKYNDIMCVCLTASLPDSPGKDPRMKRLSVTVKREKNLSAMIGSSLRVRRFSMRDDMPPREVRNSGVCRPSFRRLIETRRRDATGTACRGTRQPRSPPVNSGGSTLGFAMNRPMTDDQ
jgi:hypothetical protein